MLASVLLGVGFVGSAVLLALASYFAMRLFLGRDVHKDKELAGSVLTRIAALHALILALVFAQEMVDYQQLRAESATEANALADLYNDAHRYDATQSTAIRAAVSAYLERVIDEEWTSLANERRLARGAWSDWEAAYEAVLALKPGDERQTALRDHMLEAVHTISEQRVKRESIGRDSLSVLFWFAALAGLVFSAAAYYPYDPERRSLMLLGMFGAFTGIVLFLIHAFSNPYRPPGALAPGAFERLRAAISEGG